MTLTHEQLDELDAKAKAAQHRATEPNRYFLHPDRPMAVAWSPVIDGRDTCVPQSHADCFRKVDAELIAAADPATIIHLVAVYRAALAWSEADRRLANAGYPIGEYDDAKGRADAMLDGIRAALRGAP